MTDKTRETQIAEAKANLARAIAMREIAQYEAREARSILDLALKAEGEARTLWDKALLEDLQVDVALLVKGTQAEHVEQGSTGA